MHIFSHFLKPLLLAVEIYYIFEKTLIMNELGEALKPVLARIADFFEIFDLSILLAGALVFSGLGFWFCMNDVDFKFITNGKFEIFICIVLTYLVGLLCFTTGRLIRRCISSWKFLKLYSAALCYQEYQKKIEAHGLQNNRLLKSYLPIDTEIKMYSLLSFLWSELRQEIKYGYSLSFLKKYWSMSIAFDSLLFATVFFDIVIFDFYLEFIGDKIIKSWVLFGLYILLSIIIKISLIKNACKYDQYQNDELLGSFAALKRDVV